MTVEKTMLIATIKEDWEFNDYIRVIGQGTLAVWFIWMLLRGGRVKERLFEEEPWYLKGDAILRLSNPLLNIGIMQKWSWSCYRKMRAP